MAERAPPNLFTVLAGLGIETVTTEHEALHTVEESQRLRGSIPGAHTKNLFLKDKAGRLFLVVAEESTPIDLKRLGPMLGAKGRLSFAGADLMAETLGVAPGAVTPFGLINDPDRRVTPVLDARLAAADAVNCHPLRNTATTTIAASDLMTFLEATGHAPLVLDLPAREAAGAEPAADL